MTKRKKQEIKPLREYCRAIAEGIAASVGAALSDNDPMLDSLLVQLETEFWAEYRKLGYPLGRQEEDLVRYLLKHGSITVSEE